MLYSALFSSPSLAQEYSLTLPDILISPLPGSCTSRHAHGRMQWEGIARRRQARMVSQQGCSHRAGAKACTASRILLRHGTSMHVFPPARAAHLQRQLEQVNGCPVILCLELLQALINCLASTLGRAAVAFELIRPLACRAALLLPRIHAFLLLLLRSGCACLAAAACWCCRPVSKRCECVCADFQVPASEGSGG